MTSARSGIWLAVALAATGCDVPPGPDSSGGGGGPTVGGGVGSDGTDAGDGAGMSAAPTTRDVVDPSLPASVVTGFDGASATAGGPTVIYPATGVVLPHDLAPVDAQWTPVSGEEVFEVDYASDSGDHLRGFVTGSSWTPSASDWSWLLDAARGRSITLTIYGASQSAAGTVTGPVKSSTGISIHVSNDDATGALFYFATTGDQITGQGTLERLSLGSQKPDKFLSASNDGGHCVGCHAMTRDGSKLAFTFLDLGLGANLTVGMAAATDPTVELTAPGSNAAESVYSPDGSKLLTSYLGKLELRDGNSGAKISDVTTDGPALFPDWSPDGATIIYVRPRSQCTPGTYPFGQDSLFVYGGSLVTQSYQGGTFSNERVLLAAAATENNYYPAISPDGSLVAFTRSDGKTGSSWSIANGACLGESGAGLSYDNPSATVWVMPLTGGAPTALTAANGVGQLTNSWPKWGPKADGEYLWLSFSSRRGYGAVLPAALSMHQLWITAVSRAEILAQDPSSPAIWFPFQNTATKNHIGLWSVQVGDYTIQ